MRVVTAVINLQFSVAKQCVQWTTVVKTRSQSYHCSSTVIPLQTFPVHFFNVGPFSPTLFVITECCNATKCMQCNVNFGSNFVHLHTNDFYMCKFMTTMRNFVSKQNNEMNLLDQNSFLIFQGHHGKVSFFL